MRIYYVGESADPSHHVRSALVVDAERWNELAPDIREWRVEMRDRYGIPVGRELHACCLLVGRDKPGRSGCADAGSPPGRERRCSPRVCRQITLAQIAIALIWQFAKYELAFFAYLIAIPRHSLNWQDPFSTKRLSPYR